MKSTLHHQHLNTNWWRRAGPRAVLAIVSPAVIIIGASPTSASSQVQGRSNTGSPRPVAQNSVPSDSDDRRTALDTGTGDLEARCAQLRLHFDARR